MLPTSALVYCCTELRTGSHSLSVLLEFVTELLFVEEVLRPVALKTEALKAGSGAGLRPVSAKADTATLVSAASSCAPSGVPTIMPCVPPGSAMSKVSSKGGGGAGVGEDVAPALGVVEALREALRHRLRVPVEEEVALELTVAVGEIAALAQALGVDSRCVGLPRALGLVLWLRLREPLVQWDGKLVGVARREGEVEVLPLGDRLGRSASPATMQEDCAI